VVEPLQFLFGGRAGLGVEHTDGAQHVAVRRHHGRSGVEANVAVPRHEGIVFKPLVVGGVLHHEPLGVSEGLHAEGGIQVELRHVKAHAGLVPLAVVLDEGDQPNWGVEEAGGQVRDAVEGVFRRAFEDVVAAQGPEAAGVQAHVLSVRRRRR
jgi:hypothetical protein